MFFSFFLFVVLVFVGCRSLFGGLCLSVFSSLACVCLCVFFPTNKIIFFSLSASHLSADLQNPAS